MISKGHRKAGRMGLAFENDVVGMPAGAIHSLLIYIYALSVMMSSFFFHSRKKNLP